MGLIKPPRSSDESEWLCSKRHRFMANGNGVIQAIARFW
jgi:hypothetical protein